MARPPSVGDELNRGLHELLAADPRCYLIGEDLADPYGGAFKVARGLSTRFPERVLSTPISESAVVGAAIGLALAGDTAIAEIMFGDFAALAFDLLLNFASKSASMYGERLPLRLVVRCPVGGGRGYGPTHSQSVQKHFIGVPNLALYEVTSFHDSAALLGELVDRAEPCLLFEDKALYGAPVRRGGVVDDLFRFDFVGGRPPVAHVFADVDAQPDYVLIATGGVAERAVGAMRSLLLEEDLVGHLFVPALLYPFDPEPLRPWLDRGRAVLVVEESTAGGTWGAELAYRIQCRPAHTGPVRLVHSRDSVIPAAPHLEQTVLVQREWIHRAVTEALGD